MFISVVMIDKNSTYEMACNVCTKGYLKFVAQSPEEAKSIIENAGWLMSESCETHVCPNCTEGE